MKFILPFIFCFCFTYVNGQVLNIDREIEEDTIFKRVGAALSFDFSNDKQRRNLVDFSNTSEIDIFLKNKFLFIFLTHTEFTLNGLQMLENNGFFQFRFRDNDFRKISPDFFLQYQWNGILGMQHRALLGSNARFRWLEEKKSDLYTSIGVFYEYEKWNPFTESYAFQADSVGIIVRKLIRLNASAKFAFKIAKNIDLVGSTFIQFPTNEFFLNPRWFFDTNLNFKVNGHIGFIIHYDHNFDNYRPFPIDDFYYTISVGLNLKI